MHNIRLTEDGWGGLLCTHTPHENKISYKQWPIHCVEKIICKQKPIAPLPDVINQYLKRLGKWLIRNSTSTLEGQVSGLHMEKPTADNEASETVHMLNTAQIHL